MSAILLTVAALAVILLDLVVRRSLTREVAVPAGRTYIHNLDWLSDRRIPGRPAVAPGEWSVLVVNDLAEAERVLDELEARGFAELEMGVVNDTSFTVRWR
jgi:hypothetical protein